MSEYFYLPWSTLDIDLFTFFTTTGFESEDEDDIDLEDSYSTGGDDEVRTFLV